MYPELVRAWFLGGITRLPTEARMIGNAFIKIIVGSNPILSTKLGIVE